MPELPEVQTVVDTLRPRLIGRRVRRVDLRRDDIVTPPEINIEKVIGRQSITDIDRRGKRIVFSLDSGAKFYIHLGMTGRLSVHRPEDAILPHTHLVIQFDNASELRFVDPRRFGGIWWLGHETSPDSNMGPEPLRMRPEQLAQRLARTTRAIKNALMDQTVIAGLGNIYVDESLFAAGIHPLTPANVLTKEQVGKLNRAIKSTLRKAIRHRGSTLRDYRDGNGESGSYQDRHRVYGREGDRCRGCRGTIHRIVLGGRSTHFCPKCQPA
jgi:formamidopyrimidine-DNA glycosylase